MALKLVVTNPFASYVVGDEITDAEAVKAVLDGPNWPSVVKTTADEPEPTGDTRASRPSKPSA